MIAALLLFALTRAEWVERLRAPVMTCAEGMVQVYADCAADLRAEYQAPIARFATDTVDEVVRGNKLPKARVADPGILIHVCDGRTNDTAILSQVVTNDSRVVTRLYIKSPAYADVERLRLEVVKGFYRAAQSQELSDAQAYAAYRRANPKWRVADERKRLEDWFSGAQELPDEEALRLMRKVIEPGVASRRDVLIFSSRLYLYLPQYDLRFANGADCLSFRDALALVTRDPRIRLLAQQKADEVIVFGGGRGERLSAASEAYAVFLRALAAGEKKFEELADLLEQADAKLAFALEGAI